MSQYIVKVKHELLHFVLLVCQNKTNLLLNISHWNPHEKTLCVARDVCTLSQLLIRRLAEKNTLSHPSLTLSPGY